MPRHAVRLEMLATLVSIGAQRVPLERVSCLQRYTAHVSAFNVCARCDAAQYNVLARSLIVALSSTPGSKAPALFHLPRASVVCTFVLGGHDTNSHVIIKATGQA